jgi:Skp family chaperone for outer membrane proteins
MNLSDSIDLLVAACKLEDSCGRDLITMLAPEDIKRASEDYKQALASRKRLQEELKQQVRELEAYRLRELEARIRDFESNEPDLLASSFAERQQIDARRSLEVGRP